MDTAWTSAPPRTCHQILHRHTLFLRRIFLHHHHHNLRNLESTTPGGANTEAPSPTDASVTSQDSLEPSEETTTVNSQTTDVVTEENTTATPGDKGHPKKPQLNQPPPRLPLKVQLMRRLRAPVARMVHQRLPHTDGNTTGFIREHWRHYNWNRHLGKCDRMPLLTREQILPPQTAVRQGLIRLRKTQASRQH
ncbi:hypothetical protein MRX96_035404 [Rhipicephalus microplus]